MKPSWTAERHLRQARRYAERAEAARMAGNVPAAEALEREAAWHQGAADRKSRPQPPRQECDAPAVAIPTRTPQERLNERIREWAATDPGPRFPPPLGVGPGLDATYHGGVVVTPRLLEAARRIPGVRSDEWSLDREENRFPAFIERSFVVTRRPWMPADDCHREIRRALLDVGCHTPVEVRDPNGRTADDDATVTRCFEDLPGLIRVRLMSNGIYGRHLDLILSISLVDGMSPRTIDAVLEAARAILRHRLGIRQAVRIAWHDAGLAAPNDAGGFNVPLADHEILAVASQLSERLRRERQTRLEIRLRTAMRRAIEDFIGSRVDVETMTDMRMRIRDNVRPIADEEGFRDVTVDQHDRPLACAFTVRMTEDAACATGFIFQMTLEVTDTMFSLSGPRPW